VTKVHYTPPEQADEESSRATPGRITIFAKRGRRALPDLIRLLDGAGIDVGAVEVREPDLEAVFLALTGRALRD
jgi:ABC-2 type transport system ATP-binding protein